MLIAGPDYKLYDKFPAPGLVLRVMNPCFDKESELFTCTLAAYANQADYEAKEVWQDRAFEVRIYKNPRSLPPGGMRGPDQTQRVNYAMPEVVYGWGQKPTKDSLIAEADWPSDIYAQAYLLLSLLDEFKEFTSDEQVTQAAVQAAKDRTNLTGKKKSDPAT